MANNESEFREIPVSKLEFHNILEGGFNRILNKRKVQKILNNWDDNLVNPPKVSLRNGHFRVIDGQHTVIALAYRYGDDVPVMCRVYYGLTAQEETNLYLQQNGISSNPKANEKFHAKKNSGYEKENDIFNILDKHGIKISTTTQFTNNMYLSCTKTLESCYDKYGRTIFERAFKLIDDLWNCSISSMTSAFIGGMCEFLDKHKDNFDESRFIKNVGDDTAEYIYKAAFSNRENSWLKQTTKVALKLEAIYNG